MIPRKNILFAQIKIIGSEQVIPSGWLFVEGNQIHSFGKGKPPLGILKKSVEILELPGLTLLPGFIDLHTHGALGYDFLNATAEDILALTSFFASHGVTGFLASTYTESSQKMEGAIHTIRSCMGFEKGSHILGIHLEGPWLNPSRAGAQNRSQIRYADPAEVIPYLASGVIRLIALAPEIPENRWLIPECRRRGITVAAGHTDATYEEILQAIDLGVTQVTHCFNAMSPLRTREPGVVGAALTEPKLRCELIADNIHVHPAVMKLLVNSKSAQGVILVTDSISAAGLEDGTYQFDGQRVTCSQGSARLEDGTLAGSTITMEKALKNLINASERPLDELWRCSSLNAAEAIHLEDHKGKIKAGYDADLVLLDSDLQVLLSMVAGNIVFGRPTQGERQGYPVI
ncbi:MAG: N-acetylglucosamine-6-phosphate deacetylase [Chloroflexi bacterium]|nr:N-acetylglucosamine-6-phosphate deacetylase [Chloroflexota bacterium]